MTKLGDSTAKKAWTTRKKNKEKHSSYIERTKWIRERAIFLKKCLDIWKEELGENNNICVVCGESMTNTLHTHHLDGNHKNDEAENKVKLCGSCHIIIYKAKSDEEALHDFRERHKRILEIAKKENIKKNEINRKTEKTINLMEKENEQKAEKEKQ
jgi:hypothetical protein